MVCVLDILIGEWILIRMQTAVIVVGNPRRLLLRNELVVYEDWSSVTD